MKRRIVSLVAALGLAVAGLGVASPVLAAPSGPAMPELLTGAAPAGIKAPMGLPGATAAGIKAPMGLPGATAAGPNTKAAQACPCYSYGGARQYVTAEGVSAYLSIEKPLMQAGDWHSLANLAVMSADGRQIVQVGWSVDPVTFGDSEPHLFVFRWVNGVGGCYNGCGYLPARGAIAKVGDILTPLVGSTKNFGIQYISNAWWIAYGSEWIGAFPGTVWSGATPPATFTTGGRFDAYGEVAANVAASCTDMGRGILGSWPSPDSGSRISTFNLVNPSAPATFTTYFATTPTKWNVVAAGVNGTAFRYGGPGYC